METSEQQCDNCYTTLHGKFCHRCGQEKKSYIRNLAGVVTEFLGEFSNWDARLWRTLFPLWFRPGYLSSHYVQGHRVPFVPPLRMYLFTSIIAFLILAQLVPDPSSDSEPAVINAEQVVSDTAKQNAIAETTEIELPQETPVPIKNADGNEQFTLEMPFLSETAQQRVNRQFSAVVANPELATNKFFSLAPQMMFLLLPLFALLLKILYIRSDRYYMEHLIMALNSHSFILQVGIFYLLLGAFRDAIAIPWLASIVGWLEWVVLYWIPLYLFLCQKFYYQQGWVKTFLKFGLTCVLYGAIFLSAFMLLLSLSVLWM
ncbi:Protein of unknown function [Pseudidiomarina planktonica]|uniref:DUF3667 domain-containing protein n=1 Tax=Pseudidiomarina planktonica TaxID=1323738 RepID=A0A1Y6EBX6_9GAMM|nr:DUF3667 domain-containing protein [Pseudidiomarina planktonica]RUO66341.1 DUF3667 domain-containing protein [Pseudidiomarina planktonica]SMQ58711.1 Protein of unknown function [Pseudidiomarina planktonica]